MIIKQYLDVIAGRKTQTRRLKDRYQVGKVYAVVPKMYQYTIHYRCLSDGKVQIWNDHNQGAPTFLSMDDEWMTYKPLKVRITEKRQEPLQCLTVDDAIAEGVYWSPQTNLYKAVAHGRTFLDFNPIDCYASLWDSINTKKGLRWQDNPLVWVYTFEVVTP